MNLMIQLLWRILLSGDPHLTFLAPPVLASWAAYYFVRHGWKSNISSFLRSILLIADP